MAARIYSPVVCDGGIVLTVVLGLIGRFVSSCSLRLFELVEVGRDEVCCQTRHSPLDNTLEAYHWPQGCLSLEVSCQTVSESSVWTRVWVWSIQSRSENKMVGLRLSEELRRGTLAKQ